MDFDQPEAGRQRRWVAASNWPTILSMPASSRPRAPDCRRRTAPRGPDYRPAAGGGRRQPGAPSPGQIATGLTPRVGQLDAGHRPLRTDKPRDPGQRLDVLVAPDTEVAGGDPRFATAVASTITSATPPAARLPKCTRCQSSASPSLAMYWHMGDIAIRLRSVTPRIVSGLSRSTSGTSRSWCDSEAQPPEKGLGVGCAVSLAITRSPKSVFRFGAAAPKASGVRRIGSGRPARQFIIVPAPVHQAGDEMRWVVARRQTPSPWSGTVADVERKIRRGAAERLCPPRVREAASMKRVAATGSLTRGPGAGRRFRPGLARPAAKSPADRAACECGRRGPGG